MRYGEKTTFIVDGFNICEVLFQDNGSGHGRVYRNDENIYDGYDWDAQKAYEAEVDRIKAICERRNCKFEVVVTK